MWILIMTIIFAGNSGYAGWGSSSIATAEFNTSAKCIEAGQRWANSVPLVRNTQSDGPITKWVCVEK